MTISSASLAQIHLAVVGAGPVGATAALLLSKQGYKVTLIDRQEPQPGPTGLGMDIRNVALSPASAQLLEDIEVWPEECAAAYDTMQIWEQWGVNDLVFNAADVDRPALGWIVQVAPLLSKLWQQLHLQADSTAPLNLLLGQVQSIQTSATKSAKVELVIQQEDAVKHLSVDLVVAADGAESVVRKSLAVPAKLIPTGQMALTTIVRCEHTHQNTAWQRFLVDGPLALLPASDANLCSVVWSQSEQSCQRRLALSDAAFCRELEHAFESRLGKIQAVAQRQAFPLRQQLADTAMPHPRVVLIGDALRVVHPLAGLGVNLGFEDIAALLKIIHANPHFLLDDPSSELNKFARQRHLRSESMLRALDGLKRLYGQDNPGISWLRNVGVGFFNNQLWLKRQVMREAMGLTPKL
ncbi:MAG: ubiquinone biosynthesis UbiH/UbiF/VisC/COQ6 family hydroxylase [Candidatus Azotimanducaceae bacterium]|jgi:ubiquinone biosynthesis UbiH/UbiF/VisC/COQ6 family hydroxylase|tara:strand:+ start:348 stop:1577 length:1230 start_codon:yes stop_codon:yes gene_type:complete